MDVDKLRALQQPLKQRYRDDAAAALVTFHASATVLVGEAACKVHDLPQPIAGLHPAAGGDGSQACSGDMLLQSLVACAGVTFSTVAIAMQIPIDAAQVHATATLDFRGTLGVDRETPVGIQHLELHFDVSSPATDEEITKLVELTERYCVILQTLRSPAVLETSWRLLTD